ncbi:MAG TPA: cytochrome c, partial [Bryobacteraceae bacterium]
MPVLQRLVIVAGITWAASGVAHDIITTNLTYTRDISRILARRCVACHGEAASIPLTRYEEVRPWAVAIKEQVLSRAMPPWGAVKGFGDLEPDHALSQEEIMIIAAWVIGGAPQGDPALAPKTGPQKAAA